MTDWSLYCPQCGEHDNWELIEWEKDDEGEFLEARMECNCTEYTAIIGNVSRRQDELGRIVRLRLVENGLWPEAG